MNELLSKAISRLSVLPEERQQAAAAALLDFLDRDQDIDLTAEQLAEIERRLAADDVADDAETAAFFKRMRA